MELARFFALGRQEQIKFGAYARYADGGPVTVPSTPRPRSTIIQITLGVKISAVAVRS